jgi:opacity protein-like surface antigen
MFRKVGPVVAAFLLLACLAQAQTSRSEVSASFTGNFSKESDGQGVTQTPSQSGGLLLNYRFFLGSRSAVDLNYGFTRNDQNYAFFSPLGFAGIQSNVHEATAAYVFTPFRSSRLSPFVLAGGGAMVFSPTNTFNNSSIGAETQARGAFLYCAGADYTLFGGVALRAQYRGLFYKAPDFNLPGFSTGTWGHMAEPTIGLVFRF